MNDGIYLPLSDERFGAFMLVSGFLVVAAVLGMFGIETRNKRFEEISP